MGKKILIIEDHADARHVFSMILCYAGHDTSEAENGSEAIRKALAEAPDLILMDVSLPDVSGFDLARTIKENPETTKIPIVACSGWNHGDMEAEAQKVGIVELLTKPVAATMLVDAIGRHTWWYFVPGC
jgi:CheY-like chemotaxis protein